MPRRVTRIGVIRGLLGGSRSWLVLWAAATGFRLVAKVLRRQAEVVYSEELEPGESLVITHLTHHVG